LFFFCFLFRQGVDIVFDFLHFQLTRERAVSGEVADFLVVEAFGLSRVRSRCFDKQVGSGQSCICEGNSKGPI